MLHGRPLLVVASRRSEAVESASTALDDLDTGGRRGLRCGLGSLHCGFGSRCDLDGCRGWLGCSKQLVLGDAGSAGGIFVNLVAQHQ